MSLLGRALRSTRVHSGFASSAATSLAGFVLTVTQAHTVSLSSFGAFAVASAFYGLVLGSVRSCIAQPILALATVRAESKVAVERAALVGVLVGVPLLAVAAIAGLPYLLVLSITMPGLMVYDTIRTVRLAVLAPWAALAQDSVWAVVTVVGCALSLLGVVAGYWSFVVWAAAGAVIGCTVALISRYRGRPGWGHSDVPTSTSLAFGADYLVGSGSTLVTTNLLAAFAGSPVVAAIRGAGTLLGPVNLFIGILPTLLIPSLRQWHDPALKPVRSGLRLNGLIMMIAAPLLLLIAFFPASWGQLLLAGIWPLAEPLLPFLALDTAAALAATVPLSGHRSLLAGHASLRLRIGIAVVRTTCVVAAGVSYGAVAAAATIAVTSVAASVAWWISYAHQVGLLGMRLHGVAGGSGASVLAPTSGGPSGQAGSVAGLGPLHHHQRDQQDQEERPQG